MSYNAFVANSLPAFTTSRIVPLLGISLFFSLTAHKQPEDLPVISYMLAIFSIISTIIPMLIATSGNIASSLFDDDEAKRDFFAGGFTTALGLTGITVLCCLLVFLAALNLPGMRNIETAAFKNLFFIYLPAITLLPLNLFLQLFHEANGKALQFSKIKTAITLVGSAYLIAVFSYSAADQFKYQAVAYFFITEAFILAYLLKLSAGYRFISITSARKNSGRLMRKGLPIAVGMAGQKFYFYLIVERLTASNITLTTQFSILMSVMSIITIPAQALSQVHSLHVSRYLAGSSQHYHYGLIWAAGLTSAIILFLSLVGDALFSAYGNKTIPYTTELNLATGLFLLGSALLALAMAHLRAHNDTLASQLTVNTIMLVAVIPLVFMLPWGAQAITTLIAIQGVALFTGFLILHRRIVILHRTIRAGE